MTAWQPISTAPKDGRIVSIDHRGWKLSAFWCSDLKKWVLVRPLSIESLHENRVDGWYPPKDEGA